MKDLGAKLLIPALVLVSIASFYFSISDYLEYVSRGNTIHLFWAILFLVVGVGLLLIFGILVFQIVEKKWFYHKLDKKLEKKNKETC